MMTNVANLFEKRTEKSVLEDLTKDKRTLEYKDLLDEHDDIYNEQKKEETN